MRKRFESLAIFLLIFLFLFNSTYSFLKHSDYIPKKPEKAIPILVYHLISDNIFSKNTNLFVKPKEFENQVQWIVGNGYTTIFADELSEGKKYDKPIVITFDDGYKDNYEVAFQLAKKYNIKITIFIITDLINTRKHITSDQISEMNNSGLVSIQSHTKSHSNLLKLNPAQLVTELKESRDALFKLLGKYPTAIAYPCGEINSKILVSVKRYYSFGYSTSNGTLSNSDNKYMIKRYGVGRYTTLYDIRKYIDELDKNCKSKTDVNK